MISSLFPGSARSQSSPHTKQDSGSTPATSSFTPFGRYAEVGPHKIESSHPGLLVHVCSASTLYLNTGTLLGKDITYLSQVWNVWDAQSTQEFYEQVLPYIHPKTLRPLMGICAPTVIGLYSIAGGRLSLAMEPPHFSSWCEADPYISAELKEKVIVAYQNIHARNILHNDVKLESMLIGDDNKVTIVDFCKMMTDPEPADLALEMRAVKFMLDYKCAKRTEYDRLRRAELRVEKNLRKSRLRRKFKSVAHKVGPDEPPSRDEIDFPPFSRQSLMKWDSEIISEGTTHCSGWRGRRFWIPPDMQNPPWPGKDYTPPTPPPYEPIDFAGLVKKALGPQPFKSHSQWMKHCYYFPYLWSPLPESTVSDNEQSTESFSSSTESFSSSTESFSSSTTSSGSSDYESCNEHNSTTDAEPYKKYRSPTPSVRKRSRAEDFTRPDDCSRGNKRAHRLKSSDSLAEHEADPNPWTTRRVEELDSPPSLSGLKGKGRELPRLFASPRESSPSEADLPTLADISSNPRKSAGPATRRPAANSSRRHSLAPTDSPLSSSARSSLSVRQTLVTASPLGRHPRRKSERRCSVVVKDGDEEDKVWFMSREALQDVKGYLQVKKAMGTAIDVRPGGEGDVRHSHLQVERVLRSSSIQPTRKRPSSPGYNSEENQKPKRRRSWPYASKPYTDSLPCNG